MVNFVQNLITAGYSQERAVRRVIMLIILGLMGITLIMWFFNIVGLKGVNLIFFALGGLLIFGKGTKPEVLGATVLTGGAWNLSQLKNPAEGAADGIRWWVTKGLPAIILFWFCLTGFLATWSFQHSPSSFFPIAAFGLVLFLAMTAWEKWEGETTYKLVTYYSIAIIMIALFKTLNLDWLESDKAEQAIETVSNPSSWSTPKLYDQNAPRTLTGFEPRQPTVTTPALPSVPLVINECPAGSFANALADGTISACAQVTLYAGGEPYWHDAGPGYCVYATNAAAIRIEDIDENSNGIPEAFWVHYRGNSDRVRTVVYNLNDGKTFRGVEC